MQFGPEQPHTVIQPEGDDDGLQQIAMRQEGEHQRDYAVFPATVNADVPAADVPSGFTFLQVVKLTPRWSGVLPGRETFSRTLVYFTTSE